MAIHMLEIIEEKKRGGHLNRRQIEFFISEYTAGGIPDYQTSALLMAICLRGMDDEETAWLTRAMVESGERVDLSAIDGIKVDKHSTGGVADTTTLIAAPLAAACGVPVAKMSGRGLGHTGGTLDKLLSIPGMKVEFTVAEMIALVERNGLAIVGQSADLAPADKKLYALRDVTATVESTPLIASSIMSKKIAAGCQGLVLDVKVGSGAFNKTIEVAEELARAMVSLGESAGLRVTALITDMNQPLGLRIGNALEVREAVEILTGSHKEGRLYRVAMALAAEMLMMGGAAGSVDQAAQMLKKALDQGRGMEKLMAMVQAQGGDPRSLEHPEKLRPARTLVEIRADREGIVGAMDTRAIGWAACLLGAGRQRKDDEIDPAAGITMGCRLGDKVKNNQLLAVMHVNHEKSLDEARQVLGNAIHITEERRKLEPVIRRRITSS